jgi:plasmid stabilization system protein ParE
MPTVEIDPRAEEEARVAFLWYLDRSENAAAGFQQDCELAVQRIAAAPTRLDTGRWRTAPLPLRSLSIRADLLDRPEQSSRDRGCTSAPQAWLLE